MRVFLFVIKTVFPMFVRIAALSVAVQMPDRGCSGHWNFVWQQATLVHGCTSEAQSEYGYEFVPVAANQIS